MYIHKDLFVTTINALMNQSDLENSRAKLLSDIYGSDIDPNNNSLLTNAIFNLLLEQFGNDGLLNIEHFCFEQDFGRKVNKDAEMLWEELIKELDVDFEEVG